MSLQTHVRLTVRGDQADPSAPADLLVEVPHAAWRRQHYDAVARRLVGDLPAELHAFFHVNTDVGAEQLALEVARELVERQPTRSAEVLLCRLPRTFVDGNRVVQESVPGQEGDLRKGALTPALAPYVEDEADRALLVGMHEAYVAAVSEAYDRICGAGGLALTPHTYAPRTVGIDRIDADIVTRLRECWAEPERWPLRAEVDLITTTAEGQLLADPELIGAVRRGYEAVGTEVVEGGSYFLHPATTAHALSARFPGQVLCLEVRRDLLVTAWEPFEEMVVDPRAVQRMARPLVEALDGALRGRGR